MGHGTKYVSQQQVHAAQTCCEYGRLQEGWEEGQEEAAGAVQWRHPPVVLLGGPPPPRPRCPEAPASTGPPAPSAPAAVVQLSVSQQLQ